jgi:hypothetical protein
MWGAYEPVQGLIFYADGVAEGGSARSTADRYTLNSNQFGVRYTTSSAFTVDVGRLTPLIGTTATRRLSTRNPLIGLPDDYTLDYPLGAEVSGETRHFDYRAAMVSLPSYHSGYVPDPTARLRPAFGAGYTPFIGARIGASYTSGTYLNHDYTSAQTAGRPWDDYDQRIFSLDGSFARGYLETHAEYSRGSYDVPGHAGSLAGFSYYGEAKYTLTPRFFVAARAERNKYPFIRLFGTTWTGRLTDFEDGEVGVGYRLAASTLLKTSIRADRWWIAYGTPGFRGDGGYAFAVQVSQAFDVMKWITPERY